MRKLLIFIFVFFGFFTSTFSYYTKEDLRIYYDKFYTQVEAKYKTTNEKIDFLEKLSRKIELFISKTTNKTNIVVFNNLKEINSSKISALKNPTTTGTVVQTSNDKKGTAVDIKKSYSFEELKNYFVNYVDLSKPYVLENGYYYFFDFKEYLYFGDLKTLTGNDLRHNKIDTKTTLMAKDGDNYYFITNYTKTKLLKEDTLANITNKDEFLYYVGDDGKYNKEDFTNSLIAIKNLTEAITQGKTTDDEKIKVIYKRIIDNVDYYTDYYSDGNKLVFSGIYTYINKAGVCDGYTKLFLYMLSFAGIKDVEVKRGYAFASTDFPAYGHAWVRIGNYYYDPTFDDPVLLGASKSNSGNTLYYYKLPKELLYVDRFDGTIIKDNLDKKSLDERKKIVMKNMYMLYDKYKDYPLMSMIKNRIYLGLAYDENITLTKLMNAIGYNEVNNFVFYDEKGYSRDIYKISSYDTDDATLKALLNNYDFDFSKVTLLKWTDSNGTSYKLATNIEFAN